MRTEAEVAKVLAHFEREHRIFEVVVRGVSVWRLLRLPVAVSLQRQPLVRTPLPRSVLLRATVKSIWDLVRSPHRARYATMSYASNLRIPSAFGFEDSYFERLFEKYPGGVRLYAVNAIGYESRRANPGVRSIDCTALLAAGRILARLFPVKEGDHAFRQIADLAGQHLGLPHLSPKFVRNVCSVWWWQSRLYGLLLKRLGSSSVTVADTGEFALLRACRDQGIRFIELQHGVFTPDHPDALPAAVLENADESTLLLPDALCLYGNYWRERLGGTALGSTGRLLCGGASAVEQFHAHRARHYTGPGKCLRLVLTTQGLDPKVLAAFLRDVLVKYSGPLRLTVKLHPAYDNAEEMYRAALGRDDRVQFVKGQDNPGTYALIADADLHLSIASACHFDALGIGTPTVVLGLAGWELVRGIIAGGYAGFAGTPDALVDMLMSRSWPKVSGVSSDHFVSKGFPTRLWELMCEAERRRRDRG